AAGREYQDRPQPRVHHLQQAASGGSSPGSRARPRGRARLVNVSGLEVKRAAIGGWLRWCGLAAMAGGALLSLSYAVLIVRQAIDWQAGPTLGTPIHLPLMRSISAALVLLMGVLTARTDSLGWMPLVGGLVTLG